MKYIIMVMFLISCSTNEISKWNSPFNFRSLAGNDDHGEIEQGPRVNLLIENQKAAQARYEIWNNPNSSYIYFSTFEFEEDEIGLSQIKWAVDAAKAGKVVDIVIDPEGHGLSDETILYMVKNGVNVYEFSPGFSLKGIKNRYKNNVAKHGRLRAFFKAIGRQKNNRMHDKMLLSDIVTEETDQYLGTSDNIGVVQVGGRNALASHYGINTRRAESTVTTQVMKDGKLTEVSEQVSNQRLEVEREYMIHDPDYYQKAKMYIKDQLESRYTERVNISRLEARLERSNKKRAGLGKKWRAIIAQDMLVENRDFKEYANDMGNWIKTYNNGTESAREQLADRFIQIFQNHEAKLAKLIDEEKLSPTFFADNLKYILQDPIDKKLKASAKKASLGTMSGAEFMQDVLDSIEINAHFIEEGSKAKTFSSRINQLMGPYIYTADGKFQFIKNKFNLLKKKAFQWFGFKMHIEKYDMMEKITAEADSYLQSFFIDGSKETNWLRQAYAVDSVKLYTDTVDDKLFKKKVMEALVDVAGSATGDIFYNSQYGSPTPEIMNAFENFLKSNSAAYRLSQQEINKPGVGIDENKTRIFVDKLVDLIEANETSIVQGLRGSEQFGAIPNRDRISANKKKLKRFWKEIKLLTEGDTRKLFGEVESRLKDGEITEQEAAREIIEIFKDNKQSVQESLFKYKDRFQMALERTKGFIDEDPDEILGKYKQKNLYFITNDVGSWKVGADEWVHADFHISIEQKFLSLGKGIHVMGFNEGARIHAKGMTTPYGVLDGSGNLDYRSFYSNTELMTHIVTRYKGHELRERVEKSIQSTMSTAKYYVQDGRAVRDTSCMGIIYNYFIKSIRPIL